MPGQRRRRLSHGFTLTELLTLVVLLGLMLVLTLPAASRAGDEAEAATCADHQRQIYTAMEAYYKDAADPNRTIPAGLYAAGGGAPYQLTDLKAPEDARLESGVLPNGFGWLLMGGYIGDGDALYEPDLNGDWAHNGDPRSAQALREGLNKRARVSYHYRLTKNSEAYHHGSYQYATRELNREKQRARYMCVFYPWGDPVYAHDGQFLNATFFDGSVVKLVDGYKPDEDNNGVPDGYNRKAINNSYPGS